MVKSATGVVTAAKKKSRARGPSRRVRNFSAADVDPELRRWEWSLTLNPNYTDDGRRKLAICLACKSTCRRREQRGNFARHFQEGCACHPQKNSCGFMFRAAKWTQKKGILGDWCDVGRGVGVTLHGDAAEDRAALKSSWPSESKVLLRLREAGRAAAKTYTFVKVKSQQPLKKTQLSQPSADEDA